MIQSRLILHSINPSGIDISTWLLTYPRFIHSEFMTHRCFSRNAASSRAVPIEKMLKSVKEEPALPVRWGRTGKGMQDGGVIDHPSDLKSIQSYIWELRETAIGTVEFLSSMSLAKQVANRYLEPWMHMTVLATVTRPGLENFFALRAHKAAQPEFQVLAYSMLGQYLNSAPQVLKWGDWHMPGLCIPDWISEGRTIQQALKMATALAARASYIAFDSDLTMEKAEDIHDNKLMGPPMHGSPFEHCAQAINFRSDDEMGLFNGRDYPWSNFDTAQKPSGWGQYRKLFKEECSERNNSELTHIHMTMEPWVRDAIFAESQR